LRYLSKYTGKNHNSAALPFRVTPLSDWRHTSGHNCVQCWVMAVVWQCVRVCACARVTVKDALTS